MFVLLRIQGEDDKPVVLEETRQRIENVDKNLWRSLALELRGQDHFQFLRGYTAGLQEYIEALSFYHYLGHRRLIQWKTVQEQLTFVGGGNKGEELEEGLEGVKIDEGEKGEVDGEDVEPLMVVVPQTDYVLGLADLTGELMRNAINAVAAGHIDVCFSLLTFLQQIDDGFNRLDRAQTPNQINR